MPHENDILSNELEVKVLEQSDDLSTFDCSTDDLMGLNDFIHSEAHQYQNEKLGVTYLFLHNGNIVGYATLSMSQIEIKEAPHILPIHVTVKHYPALQIGRLAIDNNYRNRNVGTNICLWCLNIAQKLSGKVGCRLVIVLTKGKTVEFYKKIGFELFPKYERKVKKWMYLQVP